MRSLLSQKRPNVLLCLQSRGIRKLQTTTKGGQRIDIAAVKKEKKNMQSRFALTDKIS
jgi:hypothetical protein